MRAIVVLVLGVLAAAGAEVEVGGAYGYHMRVGIPEARRIKEGEDQILQRADGRIVGGVAAPVQNHPFLAGLIINLVNIAGNSVCGSSMLSHNRLLTAAHCWNDGQNQAWQFTAVFGSQFLFTGGTRVPTSHVVMHHQWIPSMLLNDVAVIYLPTSVPLSNIVQPIALPSGSQLWEQFTGEWATAAGYGKTNDQQVGVTTGTFRSQVTLQVISVAQCQASFGTWAQPSNVCTSGAGGVGICGGDSGGPLYVVRNGQPILIGVSSFVAAAGCQLGHPSAFARVTSFQSWIQQHMW